MITMLLAFGSLVFPVVVMTHGVPTRTGTANGGPSETLEVAANGSVSLHVPELCPALHTTGAVPFFVYLSSVLVPYTPRPTPSCAPTPPSCDVDGCAGAYDNGTMATCKRGALRNANVGRQRALAATLRTALAIRTAPQALVNHIP